MTNPLIEILRRNAEGYINTSRSNPTSTRVSHAAPPYHHATAHPLHVNHAPVFATTPLRLPPAPPPCFRYNKIKPLDESTRNSVTPLLTSTREDEDEDEEEEGNAHL